MYNCLFFRAMGVGLFYGAFIIVGGLLALLLSTVAVAAASSLGGSYAVFWGKCFIFLYPYPRICNVNPDLLRLFSYHKLRGFRFFCSVFNVHIMFLL